MATRSTRLFLAHLQAKVAYADLYTPPSGFVAIVKTVILFPYAGAAGPHAYLLRPHEGSASVYLRRLELAEFQVDEWHTWFVLEQGDAFVLEYPAPPVTISGFGAVLPDT